MSDINAPSTPGSTPLELSREQQFSVDRIIDYFKKPSKPFLALGGFAGTGKTTVIKTVKQRMEQELLMDPRVTAFTGKACSVLRRKSVFAETSHSIYYEVHTDSKTKLPVFTKRGEIENCDSLIVDEASMYGGELFKDALSFKLPILFVGDPGQLEPVAPDDPNLMKNPDLLLQKIHRQAEGSPIIDYSLLARTGQQEAWARGSLKQTEQSLVRVLPKPKSTDGILNNKDIQTLLTYVDQIIVPTNKMRIAFNLRLRSMLGFNSLVQVGDRVMCVENNRQFGVFNGQQFVVTKVAEDNDQWNIWLDLEEVGTGLSLRVPVLKSTLAGTFDKATTFYKRSQSCLFDFCYAITCHKSQGSEWDKVLVIEQWMPPKIWDMKRWSYTAITRAAKELYYVR